MSRRLQVVLSALLVVLSVPSSATGQARSRESGRTRTYYIAADSVAWDYIPGGRDQIADHPYADSGFFRTVPPRPVSTVYQKVLYREYTDSTFRTLKPRPPEWAHLGFLGPVLHAEVGDTIRVVFRNNGPQPCSVHPHGVFYTKDSEGALYGESAPGPRQGTAAR